MPPKLDPDTVLLWCIAFVIALAVVMLLFSVLL